MTIIDDLKKERINTDCTIEKLIDNIYDQLLKTVKFKNKHCITNMTYNVPHIFLGFPLYNVEEVTYKLSNLLKKKGFKTTVNKRDIYISW